TKKAGNFSVFGLGGLSDQSTKAEKDSTLWENSYDRYTGKFVSNTGVVGVRHDLVINSSTLLRNSVVVSANENGYDESRLDDAYNSRLLRSEEHTSELQSRENLVCRLLLEKKKKHKVQM